ncbi:MAG: hypothetical protein RL309_1441 [Verrucomicrobiota bacterium]
MREATGALERAVVAGEAGAAREEAIIPGEADAAVLGAFEAHFAFVEEVR